MPFSHVLVTRPQPQANVLARLLGASGFRPLVIPALTFEAGDERVEADKDWMAAVDRWLIFTSPRSVTFGLPAVRHTLLPGARLASIGPATTRALQSNGLDAIQGSGPTFDSENLLQKLEGEPVSAAVILAAHGGREALQAGLRARGSKVRLAPVYQRRFPDPTPDQIRGLADAESLLSIWTSQAAMRHLLKSLPESAVEKIRQGRHLVISQRLAEHAASQGLSDVQVARGPGNALLLQSCQELR